MIPADGVLLNTMKRLRNAGIITSDLLLFPVMVFFLFHFSFLPYGMQQLYGQLRLMTGARPVPEVLEDAAVADSVKQKLQLIAEIRTFAFDELGLVKNENYTSFFDLKGEPPVYVVTACEPFKLKAYEWDFPVIGKLPYKGFFVKERALRERRAIRATGLDAYLGSASGWSTLGWMNDPVLSNMLDADEGNLAELIIHELTHGTLFVKDSAAFNENLASFVGYKGAMLFLEKKFGKDSPQQKQYAASREKEARVEKFMLAHAHVLDSLYKQMEKQTLPNAQRNKQKFAFYATMVQDARRDFSDDSLFAERLEKRLRRGKNAVLMNYVRYVGKQDDFESDFQKLAGGDLKKYVALLREKWPSL